MNKFSSCKQICTLFQNCIYTVVIILIFSVLLYPRWKDLIIKSSILGMDGNFIKQRSKSLMQMSNFIGLQFNWHLCVAAPCYLATWPQLHTLRSQNEQSKQQIGPNDYIISDECIPDVQGLTETELTATLANHLFGKLATTANYVMDAKCAGKKTNQCLCGGKDCILTGRYGDTSIGTVCVLELN